MNIKKILEKNKYHYQKIKIQIFDLIISVNEAEQKHNNVKQYLFFHFSFSNS